MVITRQYKPAELIGYVKDKNGPLKLHLRWSNYTQGNKPIERIIPKSEVLRIMDLPPKWQRELAKFYKKFNLKTFKAKINGIFNHSRSNSPV